MTIKANVKEIERPGRNVLVVTSRKGKPLKEFPCQKGIRNDVVKYFIDQNYTPVTNAPVWVSRGIERLTSAVELPGEINA